jgi:hypothetical protein
MQNETIFHYTSIESLAMILSTGRLRFARLDTVDDVTEAQTFAGISFGKYFFVSCWTQEQEDNIAQWKMYGGDMEGIRIEFPTYPFKDARLQTHGEFKANGEMYGPIPTSEWVGRDYMITLPMAGNPNFGGHAQYVDNVPEHYAAAIKRSIDPGGRVELKIDRMYDLGRLKSKTWKFQSEYRFVLYVLPVDPPFPQGVPISPTIDQIANCGQAFLNGADTGARFIDISYDPAVLDQMVIRLGPLCTAGGRVCVEALRDRFAPNAKIEASPLTGMVRRKG